MACDLFCRVIDNYGDAGVTWRLARLLQRRLGAQVRIFIDDDTSYIYDLSTKARFINASDYGITTPKMLYGFLCGLAASDFDLENIYIDGLLRIIGRLEGKAAGAAPRG